MPAAKTKARPAGQAARSEAMRARLVAATKQSLMDIGYGRTTAVEVCIRAGVTRGALFHHFDGLPGLFAATLDEVCTAIAQPSGEVRSDPRFALSDYIDLVWSRFGNPDFKIVIEVWLAARNDAELRKELQPVIVRFKQLASPEVNIRLAELVGNSPEDIAFYRLILESMIGMALGRAVTPEGKPMGHEDTVVALLKGLARSRSTAKKSR
jgi:AcrR family transcriptional regulator